MDETMKAEKKENIESITTKLGFKHDKSNVLNVLLWTGLVITSILMTVLNYYISVTIFMLCGFNVWTFVPVFTFVTLSMSTLIYFTVKKIVSLRKCSAVAYLKTLSLLEFTSLMSEYIDKSCVIDVKDNSNLSEDQSNLNNACLVCYENIARTTSYPCKHTVMCGMCAWKYIGVCLSNHQRLRCILCRTDIVHFQGDLLEVNEGDFNSFVRKYTKEKKLQ